MATIIAGCKNEFCGTMGEFTYSQVDVIHTIYDRGDDEVLQCRFRCAACRIISLTEINKRTADLLINSNCRPVDITIQNDSIVDPVVETIDPANIIANACIDLSRELTTKNIPWMSNLN